MAPDPPSDVAGPGAEVRDAATANPAEVKPGAGRMRHLAAGGAITLIGVGVTGLTGWLRSKGLALTLGPAGLGLYGQCWVFALYAGQLGGLGIGPGATKLIAERRERIGPRDLSDLLGLVMVIPLLVGAVVLVLALALAVPASHLLLGRVDTWLFVLACLSIPFVSMQNPLQHVLQGFEDAWGQTAAYSLYGVVFTVVSIAGAITDGVTGAVAGLLLGNVALVAFYLARQRTLLRAGGARRPSVLARAVRRLRSTDAGLLVKIGGASLVIAVAYGASELTLRSLVRGQAGNAAAGLWFALLLLSVQFTQTLTGALSYLTGPLIARAAGRGNHEEIRGVLDDSLRLTLVAVTPVLVFLALARAAIATIFFSHAFAGLAPLIPAMMVGDFLRAVSWPLGVGFVPLSMVRSWAWVTLSAIGVFALAGIFGIQRFGLHGAVDAWIAYWFTAALLTIAVLMRRGAWYPTRQTGLTTLLGASGLAVAGLTPLSAGIPACALLMVAMLMTGTRPSERAAVAHYASARLRRR